MRALAILLLPTLAFAGPTYVTSMTVTLAEESDAIRGAFGTITNKLDRCWRTGRERAKARVIIEAGTVRSVTFEQPTAAKACITRAFETIKFDATTRADATVEVVAQSAADLARKNRALIDAMVESRASGVQVISRQPGTGGIAASTASGLGPDAIHRVMRSHAGEFRACYTRELARGSKLAGKVVVGFTINADGKVLKASIGKGTTLRSQRVHACISSTVLGVAFPASGDIATATYPFSFNQAP